MKIVRFLFMVLATSLLMLHSFVPHEHDRMAGIVHFHAHQSPTSLVDLIKLAFHENPGENHLEDYQTPVMDFYFPENLTFDFHTTWRTLASVYVAHTESPKAVSFTGFYFDLRGSPIAA